MRNIFEYLFRFFTFFTTFILQHILKATNIMVSKMDSDELGVYLAKKLNDENRTGYYKKLASKIPAKYLLQALNDLEKRESKSKQKIYNRAAYFMGILKKNGVDVRTK